MKKMDLPVYEIVIDEEDNTGVRFISLVDEPAIEVMGKAFNKFKFYDRPPVHPHCYCTVLGDTWILQDTACPDCIAKKEKFDRAVERKTARNKRKAERRATQNIFSAIEDEEDEFGFAPSDFEEPNEKVEYKFATNEDKQIIAGPALIPNRKIIRKDENGDKYYVVFSPDTIKKIVAKFNKTNNNTSINNEHTSQMVNAYLLSNWIIEDPIYDKAKYYGFNLPVGTWFVEIKVDDKQYWDEVVKNGKQGFSVEGVMGQKIIRFTKENKNTVDEILDRLITELFDGSK